MSTIAVQWICVQWRMQCGCEAVVVSEGLECSFRPRQYFNAQWPLSSHWTRGVDRCFTDAYGALLKDNGAVPHLKYRSSLLLFKTDGAGSTYEGGGVEWCSSLLAETAFIKRKGSLSTDTYTHSPDKHSLSNGLAQVQNKRSYCGLPMNAAAMLNQVQQRGARYRKKMERMIFEKGSGKVGEGRKSHFSPSLKHSF